MDMLSAGLTLLLIMDPLGNIPLFLSFLKTVDDESRKRQILIRELCFALLVLLIFLFVGQYLLLWLNLRQEAVSIAGGIVLFLISLRMIFPTEKGIMGEMPAGEPFLFRLRFLCWQYPQHWRCLFYLPDLNQIESLNG
jgi:multiple antibiotic resistance protein